MECIFQVLPAAHRGFLERSRRVPVERLLHQAQMQNKKLLLCGHVGDTAQQPHTLMASKIVRTC